jgi:hypothetical protein
MLLSAMHKLIHSVWNKEELPDKWKNSIILPVQKSVTELTVIIITAINSIQNCNEYPPLSRLNPYTDEIIGDHRCGFRRNR